MYSRVVSVHPNKLAKNLLKNNEPTLEKCTHVVSVHPNKLAKNELVNNESTLENLLMAS